MKMKGLMGIAAAAGTSIAHAQTTCLRNVGPDVIVGDITGPSNYGASGGLDAFSLGTYSCNPGNVWLALAQALALARAGLPGTVLSGLLEREREQRIASFRGGVQSSNGSPT